MLGLGDIALPGFLIALALRCDIHYLHKLGLPLHDQDTFMQQDERSKTKLIRRPPSRLFEYSILGYVVGLVTAFYIGSISGHAQPALIYLVPGVLIPISIRAWQMGIFLEVWNGPTKEND